MNGRQQLPFEDNKCYVMASCGISTRGEPVILKAYPCQTCCGEVRGLDSADGSAVETLSIFSASYVSTPS